RRCPPCSTFFPYTTLFRSFIAGCIATCNALSSAQLAAQFPFAGGTYDYGNRLLSPLFGFSAGWMFLISKLSAGSVVAIGFGSYLDRKSTRLNSSHVKISYA